jgi:hypothetical protein
MKLFKDKIRKIKNDDKGSALIVCIIILLFVSILATVILYMSGINYRMKKAELNTRISFYTGEEPLERIQSNLIVPISETMNNAYAIANTRYMSLATPDDRRRFFYTTYAEQFKDLIISQYGGSSIGNSGSTITDSALIKNILHNLSYSDIATNGTLTDTGVPISDIYVNDGSIIPDNGYDENPMGFIETLAGMTDAVGDPLYFTGNPDGSPRIYLVATGKFDNSGSSHNYDQLVRLSVTSNTSDDPVHPTGTLLDAKLCRIVFKNVCVVLVQNGYTSIITTDIAMEFPPLDWGGGASTSGYCNWQMNKLIYYVNWKRN